MLLIFLRFGISPSNTMQYHIRNYFLKTRKEEVIDFLTQTWQIKIKDAGVHDHCQCLWL